MERELMTREELMKRIKSLEEANLELQKRNLERQKKEDLLNQQLNIAKNEMFAAKDAQHNYYRQLKGTIRGLERTRDKQQSEINSLNKKIMKLSNMVTGLCEDRDKWKDSWMCASEAAYRCIRVYQEEHGFNDYRAAQAEIMQKYDAFMNGCELYGKAVKGVSND